MKQKLLSAGVVIVHSKNGKRRYLLLRCYHYWDFPKGVVETGETPFSAACREVQEETGIETLNFNWGQVFVETAPYNHGKTARYYLATAFDDKVMLRANPDTGRLEHHEYRWLEYVDARSLLNERLLPVIDWAHAICESEI
jgi:8-oxo-dGTP pyrophosphatase MutT (NUDIX family)